MSIINISVHAQVGDLVWEDNFNKGQLDSTYWSYETGTGVNGDWGTGQLDRARTENVTFQDSVPGTEDGTLVITTRKENYIDRNYTSGRIKTEGKISFGPGHRIVARIHPKGIRYKGQGFAFWLMPDEVPEGWDYIMWPQGGEVDIMEYVGSIPYHNLSSVHYAWFWEENQWQSWNHGHQGAYYSYEYEEVPDPSEPGYGNYPPPIDAAAHAGSSDFHLYGIDWYEDRMEFFVDSTIYHIHYFEDGGAFNKDGQDQFIISSSEGKRVAKSEYSHHFEEWYPFEHKMYLILSAGVGGGQNTYGGAIVPEAEFPASVFVDWIRVYELETTVANTEEKEEIPSDFVLHQNYPNPFNPSTNIKFGLPKASAVKLEVYNVLGQKVLTKIAESMNAGSHNLMLDMTGLPSGVYLYTLQVNDFSDTKKMLFLK